MTASQDNTDLLGIAEGTPKEKRPRIAARPLFRLMMEHPYPQSEDQGAAPA